MPARGGDRVLEVGCGAGAALLCLGVRVPGLALAGLELQPAYAALARDNAARNGLPAEIWEGDAARPPAGLRAQSFDHALFNPPFHGARGATAPADAGRAAAHMDAGGVLAAFADCALRRLRPRGSVTVIHRAEALDAVLAALAPRVGDLRILPLAPRAGRPAGRVLVRGRKGAKGPLLLLPPLVIHAGAAHLEGGAGFTPAARAVLERAAALDLAP